jgi:hypothetical protein
VYVRRPAPSPARSLSPLLMPPTVQAACGVHVVNMVFHVRLAISRIVPRPGEHAVVVPVSAVVGFPLPGSRRSRAGVVHASGVPAGCCLAVTVPGCMRSPFVLLLLWLEQRPRVREVAPIHRNQLSSELNTFFFLRQTRGALPLYLSFRPPINLLRYCTNSYVNYYRNS